MVRIDRGTKDAGAMRRGIVLFMAIVMTHCIGTSSSLQLPFSTMVAASWQAATASKEATVTAPIISSPSRGLNVPAVELSMASAPGINAVYYPMDPTKIPTGFARMCNKAGGFAPRPIWDDLTNSVTPWFESKDGCFIYFNCNDAHWYVDNSFGAGMYLAVPDDSLLLPPKSGWVFLTGRRAGAPKMSYL